MKEYVDDKVADIVAGSIEGLGALAAKDQVAEADLESALAAKINGKADQTTVDTLVGADTGKSVRTIANEELAAQLIPEGAQESLNTLQEIAQWIQDHPDDAAAMNTAIEALETKVDTGEQTVSAYVTAAIAALNIGDYATAAALTAVADRVTTLEGASHTHANKAELDKIADGDKAKWDAAEQNAKDYADGLAGNYDAAGSATAAETSAKQYADSLASNYDPAGSATAAETNAKAYTDTALTWGSF